MPSVVSCDKCHADLSDGAQFCTQCGEPVSAGKTVAASTPSGVVSCQYCGAKLSSDARFCGKCGQVIPAGMNAENSVGPPAASASLRPRARRNSRLALWIFLVLVFGGAVWAVMSESQTAQEIQEAVGWKHDQSILEESFTVGPRNFQYFKFSLPEGSVNISVIGQFNVTGASGKEKDKDVSIETYVLTEPAFTVWQHGYSTSSLYESGRVPQGTIDAQLPAGAGVYYLIFNNRYAPKSSKSLHASALLRYKSWLPESLRILKDRFLNWVSW